MNTFFTTKIGCSHAYDSEGNRLFVTKLAIQPAFVAQIKKSDKDGYDALQVGFKEVDHVNKPLEGHLKETGKKLGYIKEVALVEGLTKNVGDEISFSELFAEGDEVSVHAKSKGRGFAGVVKRWGFHGGPKTHGQSDRTRAPGSIGMRTTPGRVWKGKKMSGHYGDAMCCIRGGSIVKITENEVWVTGTVPGSKGSQVRVQKISLK